MITALLVYLGVSVVVSLMLGQFLGLRPQQLPCDRCRDWVIPRLDRGDALCPRCGLVL